MAYDLQEQEQIDELKAFWDKYGNFILTVITVIALAFAGMRAWQWYQGSQAVEASGLYEQLRQAAEKRDMSRVGEASKQLYDKYSGTAFAELGALLAAKSYFEHGDNASAKTALTWAIDHAKDDEFRNIAKLRLSGILLDEKNYEDGLKLLSGSVPDKYAMQFSDRRGDFLLAQDKRDEARAAYKQAMEKAGLNDPLREVIRLKLDALGGRHEHHERAGDESAAD